MFETVPGRVVPGVGRTVEVRGAVDLHERRDSAGLGHFPRRRVARVGLAVHLDRALEA